MAFSGTRDEVQELKPGAERNDKKGPEGYFSEIGLGRQQRPVFLPEGITAPVSRKHTNKAVIFILSVLVTDLALESSQMIPRSWGKLSI